MLKKCFCISLISAACEIGPLAHAQTKYELIDIPAQFGGIPDPTSIADDGTVVVNEDGKAYLFNGRTRAVDVLNSGGNEFTFGTSIAPDGGVVVGQFGTSTNRLPGILSVNSPPILLMSPEGQAVPQATDGINTVGYSLDASAGQPRAITFGSAAKTLIDQKSRAFGVDGDNIAAQVDNHPARLSGAVPSDIRRDQLRRFPRC